MNVHHNGFGCGAPGFCHGIYIHEGILIDGGEYHHNESFGIHCYGPEAGCVNATIRNVRAYSNGASGIGVFGFANANVAVYNNLVYDNLGLGINAGAGGDYYNNTVVNNAAGSMAHGMLPAISRNNILISGGTYSPVAENWGTSQNLGDATQSDNITSGTASDYFVEASNGDFRLKSSAAQAINQGINLSNVFTTDITRANRDSQFDIGAFEFEASSVSSPPRTNPAPPPSTEFP